MPSPVQTNSFCAFFSNRGLASFLIGWVLLSCTSTGSYDQTNTLRIIHAGSLTLPVKKVSTAFQVAYPEARIKTEAWGSKAGARRIADIEANADLFLSADYMVIEHMLIPNHASWYIPFATNEMAIVFTPRSRMSQDINTSNWMDILLMDNITYGRSNPDMDPCGVRSVFAIQLAEKMYNRAGFTSALLAKDTEHIRPKETDLIALLESNHLDYIFLYRSVAVQHGLEYLKLPDSINLGNFCLNDWYRNASIETLGSKPGEQITEYGEAMVYGLTIPHKSSNPALAKKFIAFLLDDNNGQAILSDLGQPPVASFKNPHLDNIPPALTNLQ